MRIYPGLWFPGRGPVAWRTMEHPTLDVGICMAMQRSSTDATKTACAADRKIWLISTSATHQVPVCVQADGKARLVAGKMQHLSDRASSYTASKPPKLQPW